MRKLLGVFAAIVCLVALLLAQQPRDVLARVASAEFGAKSLTASGTLQQVGTLSSSAPAAAFAVSLAKPNKARIDMPTELIVADGATITSYDKAAKTYMKRPQTDADLKALFACNELSLFGGFFDPGFFSKVQGGKLGKKSRKGASYDVIEVGYDVDGPNAASFFADPTDKMLKMAEFTPTGVSEPETTVVLVKEISVDGEQRGDPYAFKAPEGSREVTAAELAKANIFEAPAASTEKALGTWHLYQCDERGNFPNGGKDFCAPTASSNALVYLGLNGYPNLFQGDDLAALKLISLLSSPDYMGTDPNEGTGDSQVIRGILKYVGLKGYGIQSAEYRGWRPLDRAAKRYETGKTVDLDWVRTGIARPNSIVLMHLGWFNKDASGNYNRVQGHWITATGYGGPDGGSANPNLFYVHNPGISPANMPSDPKERLSFDSVLLTQMTTGTLQGTYRGLPIPARGNYQVVGKGVPIREAQRVAVLDGVVVIVLRPSK
jgi:hypothetical protein